MIFIVLGYIACVLTLLLRNVLKINAKIENPDERPKHERHWGWGRKKK